MLRGHKQEVWAAAFEKHGSLLVSRSADGESRVWDMELAERNGILRGHDSFVYDVAFSPDGTRAASAAWDGTRANLGCDHRPADRRAARDQRASKASSSAPWRGTPAAASSPA